MPSSKQLLQGSKMWSLLLVPRPYFLCPSKVFSQHFKSVGFCHLIRNNF